MADSPRGKNETMTEAPRHPTAHSYLRRLAEEKAQAIQARQPETLSSEEAGRLIHELQVHKIELELQNEELRRAQGELEASRARYFDLYDLAPVGYFSLSEQGLILEANLAGAGLLGLARRDLINQPISRYIFPEDQDFYYRHRKQLLETGEPRVCELRMLRANAAPFWARLETTVAHDTSGATVCHTVMSDISQGKRIEDIQTFLLQHGCARPGEESFPALARFLARSLGMDYVCIDRLVGDDAQAQTVAVYSDGEFDENVTYALKNIPYGDVVGKGVWCFPEDVRQLFPKDMALQNLKAESYVGTTLWGSDGKPIGVIAVIGRKPLADPALAESILQLVAFRAAVELERKQVEQSLRSLNAELERSVAEQTAELWKTCEVVKGERQRLFDLLEVLPVYVVLLTPDCRVLFANRSFREWFGDSCGLFCFKDPLRRRPEACERCEARTLMRIGAFNRREWTSTDGRRYDTYGFPFIDPDGSTLCLEMGIDITDHRNALRALEVSESRYRSFVTASTQIVWYTDAHGLVVGDLPSWRSFTGQGIEQIQGRGWINALHPDDRERTVTAWSRAVATCSEYTVEYRVRRHDGEYRLLSVHGVPVLAEGAIREWVGACTDITEQKRAEQESRHTRDTLVRMDRTARLGELTSSLAHELNQPLTAILSNAQAAHRLLAAEPPDLELFREILDDIIRDDKRAGSVIHRVRQMLRKERSQPERLDVNQVVHEVIELLHSEIIERRVRLSMDLAPGLPAVWAARIEVQQILVNLLLNALHAVNDLPRDRLAVFVRTRPDEGAVVVAVGDRGCGIQLPEIDSIFEPFVTTKRTGLGMGLAICRRIVQAHRGRIWAANNEDTGATVSFSLPSTQAGQESSDG